MKFDDQNYLVREAPRPVGHEIANLGDALADTCRFMLLDSPWGFSGAMIYFKQNGGVNWPPRMSGSISGTGYLRHPSLHGVKGWDQKDMTNDQLVPFMLYLWIYNHTSFYLLAKENRFFIKGTKKLCQPAVWAIRHQNWWLLNKLNLFQGWLLGLPFRWSDDETEGSGFRSSSGKVQDYLNMIAITFFLFRIGEPTRLPRPVQECIAAVTKYRHDPKDFEPNAEWEIQLYTDAINLLKERGLA